MSLFRDYFIGHTIVSSDTFFLIAIYPGTLQRLTLLSGTQMALLSCSIQIPYTPIRKNCTYHSNHKPFTPLEELGKPLQCVSKESLVQFNHCIVYNSILHPHSPCGINWSKIFIKELKQYCIIFWALFFFFQEYCDEKEIYLIQVFI